MEERISTIKKVELKKESMHGIIMFDKSLSGSDLKFLEDGFDFYKEDADRFASNYKNLGLVFNLTPIKQEFLKDWGTFLRRAIKKSPEFDKFNNMFVSRGYDKVLVVTNKRLSGVDIKKLNEKIEDINYRIESYNEKIVEEMKGAAEAAKEEHKGILRRVLEVLKK